jgi:predicted N-formylglutamate amidohydrolase
VKPFRLLLTCEHGGHEVPQRWRPLFAGREALLASHRGWDPGSLELTRYLARRLGAPLVVSTVTRLLVELNRSPHHPRLFSGITRGLPRQEKQAILAEHYRPYRGRVEAAVAEAVAAGDGVLHLSIHTFTPVLDGRERRTDVGLLYDPRRAPERLVCARLKEGLERRLPGWVIRRNHPYRGAADGLTTHLRRRFPAERYLGLEIEVNQKYPLRQADGWERGMEALGEAVASAVLAQARQRPDIEHFR